MHTVNESFESDKINLEFTINETDKFIVEKSIFLGIISLGKMLLEIISPSRRRYLQ